jgi:hypothetical protein
LRANQPPKASPNLPALAACTPNEERLSPADPVTSQSPLAGAPRDRPIAGSCRPSNEITAYFDWVESVVVVVIGPGVVVCCVVVVVEWVSGDEQAARDTRAAARHEIINLFIGE